MVMCSRCHKRLAVIFMTKIEGNESKQEGICIKCAKELGLKPVDDIIAKMGLSDEDIERMNSDIEDFMSSPDGEGLAELMNGGGDPSGDGQIAPTINFSKLMRNGMDAAKQTGKDEKGKADGKNAQKPTRKYLDTYCTNLTAKARRGELDGIVGRERELDRVIQILCRRQKNNPCLIGEPGVGKTAIAEALAQKIAINDVPYRLKKCEVDLLDLTALVAGTQFRGQFEARVLGLINEVKQAGNVILVIDEVHNIVGAGDSEGSMNAANMLKPALSRGEIQVIGATTLTEYRKYIEKDTALERRFQPVMVDEPSVDDTVNILMGIKKYYEDFHGIRIPETVIRYAVSMSERYITDRYLPDKAIDLIDEAASHIALSSKEINEKRETMEIKENALKTKSDLENAMSAGEPTEDQYKQLADITAEIMRCDEKTAELEKACEKIEMTVNDLAQVIEIWTGIPAASIRENEFERLEKLEDRLKARIIGQDEAVSAVARAVRRNRAGVSYKRKPVSFIFAGPTGVGKTELVKVLANDLFSSPETLIRLDMSEFMDKFSVSRIIGSPPGYVGYDDAGQLTEKIRRRPYSVVLFDEIEKAHPDVMNILLQILDDGRITDAHGKTVSFENTVIVMTTNAGSQGNVAAVGFSENAQIQEKERTSKALQEFLRPEFLNRVDEIITFNQLSKDNFCHIAELMLNDLKKVMDDKEIVFSFTEAASKYVAEKSYSVKYGARNMRRFIQTEIEDVVATKIISSHGVIKGVSVDADENGLIIAAL